MASSIPSALGEMTAGLTDTSDSSGRRWQPVNIRLATAATTNRLAIRFKALVLVMKAIAQGAYLVCSPFRALYQLAADSASWGFARNRFNGRRVTAKTESVI